MLHQKVLRENNIVLVTEDTKTSNELSYRKAERSEFRKKVSLDDITELVITKEPLAEYGKRFKDEDTKRVIASKEEMKTYMEEYYEKEIYS